MSPQAGPVVRTSADELAGFLGRVQGRDVPIRTAFTPGWSALVLGTNAWSAAAGVDVSGVRRDGFVIRTAPRRVFLAGADDPAGRLDLLFKNGFGKTDFERGTYHAVLSFLERFCGCRFYFPGELGTVVPRMNRIVVPATDLKDEPEASVRYWSFWLMGNWFDEISPAEWTRLKMVERLRLRTDTGHYAVAHGQATLSYPERFARSHPDFFALDQFGKRRMDSANAPGANFTASQFCYSSDVWEELYKDVRSYFRGEDASVRGIVARNGKGYSWNQNDHEGRRYFDLQPQDGLVRCRCDRCARVIGRTDPQWASDVIWSNTVSIAQRLKSEGLSGTVVQMAYASYREIPQCDIPDNVAVMVAEMGPWAMADKVRTQKDFDEISRWSEKLHGNIWLWNYAGKFAVFQLDIPDLPQLAPRSIAAYYRKVAPKTFGAYLQTNTDRFLFDYLNLYVFSRVMWNPSVDVEEILAEHDWLMFGDGAKEMGEFVQTLEKKWTGEMYANYQDTPLGPQMCAPGEYERWTKVYSPAVLDRLDALLSTAARKVKAGSLEARRIALYRREMFEPFARTARNYQKRADVDSALAWNCAHVKENLVSDDPQKWNDAKDHVDRETFLTPPHSYRMESEDCRSIFYVFNDRVPKLKPNTRYRFSFFVKTESLLPVSRGGGVGVDITTDRRNKGGSVWFPKGPAPCGTRDWIRQEFEFRTFDVVPEKNPRASFALRIRHAKGTAWFDEVRIDEIGPVGVESQATAGGAGK